MNVEQVREYTLTLPGVTEDQPFGDDNITFRLEGKIFMCLWLGSDNHDIKDSEPRLAGSCHQTKMRNFGKSSPQ